MKSANFFATAVVLAAGFFLAGVVDGNADLRGEAPEFKKMHMMPRMIGGSDVTNFTAPFDSTVQIYISYTAPSQATQYAYICTGSIIHPRWILTAAHCVVKMELHYNASVATRTVNDWGFFVHAGSADKTIPNGEELAVDDWWVHPQYDASKATTVFGNDVGLLFLQTPVTRGRVIRLAGPDATPPATTGTIAGYGKTATASSAVILQKGTVQLASAAGCTNSFSQFKPDNETCISNNPSRPCQYDSGGPLFMQTASGKWRQYGVVSRVVSNNQAKIDSCDASITNSIYSIIGKFRSFICDITITNQLHGSGVGNSRSFCRCDKWYVVGNKCRTF